MHTISVKFLQVKHKICDNVKMIDLTLIQTLVVKYPLNNHGNNNVKFMSKCKIGRAFRRTMKQLIMLQQERQRRKMVPKMVYDSGDRDAKNGFGKTGEFQQNNELLNSGINPLMIGYSVAGFEQGSHFGNGYGGGEGDGGNGDDGNGNRGDAGDSEANNKQTGLFWWLFWQWNRAVRPLKRGRTMLRFPYNDRNQLIESTILMLAAEVLPPTDFARAALDTTRVIEELIPLLLQALMFPIVGPLILLEFWDKEPVFAATIYTIFGASVALAAVVSGAVIYGSWCWYNKLRNHDGGDENAD